MSNIRRKIEIAVLNVMRTCISIYKIAVIIVGILFMYGMPVFIIAYSNNTQVIWKGVGWIWLISVYGVTFGCLVAVLYYYLKNKYPNE